MHIETKKSKNPADILDVISQSILNNSESLLSDWINYLFVVQGVVETSGF